MGTPSYPPLFRLWATRDRVAGNSFLKSRQSLRQFLFDFLFKRIPVVLGGVKAGRSYGFLSINAYRSCKQFTLIVFAYLKIKNDGCPCRMSLKKQVNFR
jgi:hypothetical protein